MTTVLLENVSFGYKRKELIFKDIDLRIGAPEGGGGHVSVIMGSSGCGKTTMLRLISGLEKPRAGHIKTDPGTLKISYVPQEPVLFEHLGPLENARYLERIRSYENSFDESVFDDLCETLGLTSELKTWRSVKDLSGGERQRLSLLRALSIQPDLLLLDEPCAGLDVHVKQDFLQKLRQIVATHQLLVVYVTHHRDEAELAADEVIYLLKQEQSKAPVSKVVQGSVQAVIASPGALEVARAFNSPALNVLTCLMIDDDTLQIVQDESIGDLHALPSSKVYLGFKPDAVRPSRGAGITVDTIGASSVYSYVQLKGNGAVLVMQSGDEATTQPINYVAVRGSAFLYGPDGMGARVVQIESDSKSSLCLKICHS